MVEWLVVWTFNVYVYVYVFAIYSRRYIDISKIVIFRDYSNKLHDIDFIYPSNLLKNFLDTSYPY